MLLSKINLELKTTWITQKKCTNLDYMDTEETFFLALKNHRESNQITLDEISEFTKINPKYLSSIEEGNFDTIPNVYMRLFIRSYSKYIGADYNQALADYELYTTGKIQPKFSQSAYFRFHNKSEIFDGLYFVGAGTHPGAGVPGVLSSAKVLDKIL